MPRARLLRVSTQSAHEPKLRWFDVAPPRSSLRARVLAVRVVMVRWDWHFGGARVFIFAVFGFAFVSKGI